MTAVQPPDQTRQPVSDIGLVDLLDRVLEAGVVVSGDVVLSLADVDLVYLNLRLLLGSVDTLWPDRPA
jgi:hypothetical protein